MADPPTAYACALARDRFWQDEQRRLIGTHPEWPDAAYFLDLGEELAHALVLVLSRLPAERRREFADAFYAGRSVRHAPGWADRPPLALAAALLLQAVDLLEPELCSELVLDLLQGAAQGDDLSRTPEPAARELRKTIARIRFDVEPDDSSDPRRTAALALAEVLDPASDGVDLKEVLARSAWAAVETWEPERVLRFLLDAERTLSHLPLR